ncbi:DUF3179 domain-containing protein [Halobaculum sp. WSA2]|uniref:DUF3179 domain-containing protein n=1 Tax=Halobaculum saliterrae TaxID=2073113 RepID=A0A6B0SPI1_9EURY|nr:DUF3179 domain-containing protein [Halobaculum saliterrae]MXR40828.1 DUF3179 domain-containing protein [Halobaculum saliterrae]
MSQGPTRRRLLGSIGLAGAAAVAGCLDGLPGREVVPAGTADASGPPSRDGALHQPWPRERLREETVGGGPDKDGIPSVDEPSFASPGEVTLADDEVVFGYAGETDVKAYTQRVLVWHEITNDSLDGTPVAVTYCPLTGTAMGFERGDTTLGVSGKLVNNNLVMYDRATDSRWPQVLATAVDGPREGDQLREFGLTWTTWGRWREAHPDTEVLTEDTGYAKRYGSDPYGNYNPTSGYYGGGGPLFPPLDEGWAETLDEPKRVVIGTRTADRAVAFDKPALRERRLLETAGSGSNDDGGGDDEADGGNGDADAFLAAYDPGLDTGWVYRSRGASVEPDDDSEGLFAVEGETYRAGDLPLERAYAFDAMWHAWGGFYPETAYVA